MQKLGTLEESAKALEWLGHAFPLTVADRAENPLGKRASKILSIQKLSYPFRGRVLLLDSGAVLFCQDRTRLREGDWLISMKLILDMGMGNNEWYYGSNVKGLFVLGFQPSEAEWEVLKLMLLPNSYFCEPGTRRPPFPEEGLNITTQIALPRKTLSRMQAQLSLFRKRGSYRTSGAVRIGRVRGPYWPNWREYSRRLSAGRFSSAGLTRSCITVLSAGSRQSVSCYRLSNCSAHELYIHPWDGGKPLNKFARWLTLRFAKKKFRERLQKAPACMVVSEGRPEKQVFRITVGCEGRTAVVNGIRLPERKLKVALHQAARHIGRQGSYDEFLSLYRNHSLAEIEAMRQSPYSLTLHVPGRGWVHLRLEAVKEGDDWFLSLEGRKFQRMLSKQKARFPVLTADPLQQDSSGWRELKRLGIQRKELIGAVRRRLAQMMKADRKARHLLSKLSAKYPTRIRVLTGNALKVVVKGKLRDYLVTYTDGYVQVREHPSGKHVCIEDPEIPPCPVDGIIGRVMSLLNDRSLTDEIYTLREEV